MESDPIYIPSMNSEPLSVLKILGLEYRAIDFSMTSNTLDAGMEKSTSIPTTSLVKSSITIRILSFLPLRYNSRKSAGHT